MLRYFYICYQKDCFRRGLDAGKIFRFLEENGWKPSLDLRFADLIVIITCGGFECTESRCIKTIRKALDKRKASTKIVVTGCLVKINPSSLKIFDDIEIIPTQDLFKLDSIIKPDKPYGEIPDANTIPEKIEDISDFSMTSKLFRIFSFDMNFLNYLFYILYKRTKLRDEIESSFGFNKSIFKIKVADGCVGKCTYCVLRIAAGKLKSKPEEDIIKELKRGIYLGFDRFELVSLDLGCYGLDIGTNILDLVKVVFTEAQNIKLIINDLNIHWLVKYPKLLKILCENKGSIEHLRIPIQSGSDKILKLMKRPYTKSEIYAVMKEISHRMPDIPVNTHLIVGFPGENHEDFLETEKLMADFSFNKIDVFCYQDRPGAKSTMLPNKLDKRIKIKRAQRLAGRRKHIDIVY